MILLGVGFHDSMVLQTLTTHVGGDHRGELFGKGDKTTNRRCSFELPHILSITWEIVTAAVGMRKASMPEGLQNDRKMLLGSSLISTFSLILGLPSLLAPYMGMCSHVS